MSKYKEKIKIVHDLKEFLEEHNFIEVITPTIRKNRGELIKRIEVENDLALRDSHELQLRCLLTEFDSVYEIGSCFRREDKGSESTNEMEFLLLELFTKTMNLEQLKEMLEKFILRYISETDFEQISIAHIIKLDLGVDLYNESQELLYQKLQKKYLGKMKPYEYVQKYIKDKIEPLSKGKLVFFTDYPECTCSYADIKGKGGSNVIHRFELFADEIELANAFEDECNAQRFIERNREYPIFENEESCIAGLLSDGSLPLKSAGVGIGIERLCMFLLKEKDIRAFRFPIDIF